MEFQGFKSISEENLLKRFNEFLDEVYGDVKISAYTYNTSQALESVDPITYREEFNNWLDRETGESLIEIKGKYFDKQALDDAGIETEEV